MFSKRWLLTILLAVFCQDWAFNSLGNKCQLGVLADNSTLVVMVTAEPGVGQDLIRDLIKSSQNATLRATDSKGTPLRPLDDENKGPSPLGPRRRHHLEPSPHADPPEPGKRCPLRKPPMAGPPQNASTAVCTTASSDPANAVVAADKVTATNQDGVDETINLCDEGCEAAAIARTEAMALKEFGEVVEGGTEVAIEAAKDGEEIKKVECRPCKKSDACEGIQTVNVTSGEGEVGAPAGDGTCPAPDSDPKLGKEVDPTAGKIADPCKLAERKKGADPCRPADGKEENAKTDPAKETVTGDTVNVEVKVVEEPQCRISLEEETQVNADCRSCSARVLPSGGVKLSCFQCEHRPSDQTCYFARKVGVYHPYLGGDRGFCPAATQFSNLTCGLGEVFPFSY